MKKKITFLVNHAAFFVSHRLNLALEAKKRGYEVEILCGKGESKIEEKLAYIKLKKNNLKFKTFSFTSSELNLFIIIRNFLSLLFYLKKKKPDLIHLISPKGIILGGVLSRLLKIKATVISISGMGILFTDGVNDKFKIYKFFYILIMRYILNNDKICLIVQNNSDKFFFKKTFYLDKKKIFKIKGSGVDISKFKRIKVINSNKIVILVGRVIKEKGIREFVEAAKSLGKVFKRWKFYIIGELSYNKPSMFNKQTISEWKKIDNVKFFGYQADIFNFYKNSSIVCLPSYREGMPKTLLEASAAGRPIVTTNVIGCKEAIEKNKTGLFCKSRDIVTLKYCLLKLIRNKKLRNQLGANGRKKAIKEFDIKNVTNKVISIYTKLI